MYINTAEQISGIPSSWPGYDLTIGSTGDKVRQMQEQLNRIAKDYPYDTGGRHIRTADGRCGKSIPKCIRPWADRSRRLSDLV